MNFLWTLLWSYEVLVLLMKDFMSNLWTFYDSANHINKPPKVHLSISWTFDDMSVSWTFDDLMARKLLQYSGAFNELLMTMNISQTIDDQMASIILLRHFLNIYEHLMNFWQSSF